VAFKIEKEDLISPASHRGFHSAVCIVYVTFPRKRRNNRHVDVEVEVEVEVEVWVEVGRFGLKFKLNFKLQLHVGDYPRTEVKFSGT
jgi:hypothetical protein